MNKRKLEKFRNLVQHELDRVQGTTASLEEQARMTTGGMDAGNLSNAPMHLGDLGTMVYTQELGSTLLQNEGYILQELVAALRRINDGTYGTCENCGEVIREERLQALPYARHCTPSAEQLQSGVRVNFNDGRPEGNAAAVAHLDEGTEPATTTASGDVAPFTDLEPEPDHADRDDIHAVGTPGGGTAVGGLAGTNIGEGEPDQANLEEAMGSGNFDQEIADDDDPTTAYSGPAGGAVGGTPAEKRAVGGKTHGGIAPQSGAGGVASDSGPDAV